MCIILHYRGAGTFKCFLIALKGVCELMAKAALKLEFCVVKHLRPIASIGTGNYPSYFPNTKLKLQATNNALSRIIFDAREKYSIQKLETGLMELWKNCNR